MESNEREIPPKAQELLKAAYENMQITWEAFEKDREQFYEMITLTRKHLGIASNELWDLADDLSKFTKIDKMPHLQIVGDDHPITDENGNIIPKEELGQ